MDFSFNLICSTLSYCGFQVLCMLQLTLGDPGLLAGTMRYFWVRDIFGRKFILSAEASSRPAGNTFPWKRNFGGSAHPVLPSHHSPGCNLSFVKQVTMLCVVCGMVKPFSLAYRFGTFEQLTAYGKRKCF